MVKDLIFAISISFISWLVGIMINAVIVNKHYYNRYFSHLNFIRNSSVNKLMGMDAFRWLVENSFFRYLNPQLSMPKKIRPGKLAAFRHQMTVAEISHLIAFVFAIIVMTAALVKGKLLRALLILIINILMNLYPSLLQQRNKRRIDRCLEFHRSLQHG